MESPEAFARHVRVRDWEPVNVAPKISDVPKVIAALGGSNLYGDEPRFALRELLQNALDAVRGLRALRYLGATEGEVEVTVEPADGDDWWLHVTDTGIGMSRHVLTNVLLDFGNSLWRSDLLRDELPGLAKSGFDAVGQFGIGFYSVFMLGSQARVTTRRFERSERDDAEWLLMFEDGLQGRPMLPRAAGRDRLQRHGTQVSVKLTTKRLASMLEPMTRNFARFKQLRKEGSELLSALVGWLCPASEVALYARFADAPRVAVVAPDDWTHLEEEALNRRLFCYDSHLVALRDESGALIGRVGLPPEDDFGAVVLHGVRCGYLRGLAGLVLARENNRDARRTEASVAGSQAAWSKWATEVLHCQTNLPIDALLNLHPLLRDHDLSVWQYDADALTLSDLVICVAARGELRIHLGELSHEDDDDMSRDRFDFGFKLSDHIVITPKFRPALGYSPSVEFPWFLDVAPIDYQSRLEAELVRFWGSFDTHEENDAAVGR